MTTALEPFQTSATSAAKQAQKNFHANIEALAALQPGLAAQLRNLQTSSEWLFARDGYLTTRHDSKWWSGSSVPLRTARELLKNLELTGTLGCFLHPSHAAQVRAALDKIQKPQAVLAVIPQISELSILLHCDDFTPELQQARLFFVSGDDWPTQLSSVFEKYPGLPLPQQFLRTPLLDDSEMSDLTTAAQDVISRETARRSDRAPQLLAIAQSSPNTGKILVMAGSRIDLADLSNIALRQALLEPAGDDSFLSLDPDYPLTASPLALAESAAQADAIITADVFRADLPGVVAPRQAWITWVTSGRIAAFDSRYPSDALILASLTWRPAAQKAGWPAERIRVAGWPRIFPPAASASSSTLGLLADTRKIEIPQKVKDFSSQRLLWELIDDELSRDPLALAGDPQRYLDSRMGRLNIRDEQFDRAMFFDHLIRPARQQAFARLLLKNKIPLALYGAGWPDLAEFQSRAQGPIDSLQSLSAAFASCRAIIEPYPTGREFGAGLPVAAIAAHQFSETQLLNNLRQTLAAPRKEQSPPSATAASAAIDAALIRSLINP